MTRKLAKAAQAFEDFSGHRPTRVTRARLQHTDAAGWKLGPAVGIAYEARRGGKTQQYFHEFSKAARPDLVSRDDGKQLFLVGGKYSVTDHGIVDMPELFVVNPSRPPRRASTKGKTTMARKRRKATTQTIVVRANPARPARKRRRTTRAKARSYRRNPFPAMSRAKRPRRRYKRNPIGGGGLKGLSALIVPAMGVGGGAVGAEIIMGYLPIPASWKSGIARHITKGAVGIAAGLAISKLFKQKKLGMYVSAGAVVIATHDAIKEFIAARLPMIEQGGFAGYGQYVPALSSQFNGMGYISPAATTRFGEYVSPVQFQGASQAYDAPGGETEFRA